MKFYARRAEQPLIYEVAPVKTAWGFAAIASRGQRLVRVFLPQATEDKLWRIVEQAYPGAQRNNESCLEFQQHLRNYFQKDFALPKGEVDISWASDFEQTILKTCCKIPPATTITYGHLAAQAGYPRAARAAGGVMAKNPFPLLIPCHRVIAANGALTGYSGTGGIAMKQRLLKHER